MTRTLAVLLTAALIAVGCSGVGLIASDDPAVKVSQAGEMIKAGRAAQARRLLNEAIATHQNNGDELGLAEAHRQFGFLARIGGGREGVILVRDPETQPMTPEDWELSDQHFSKAAELFTRQNRPDMVANVYFNLGVSGALQGDSKRACSYFDQSLEAHRRSEIARPGGAVDLPRNIRSFAELIAGAKAKAGCGA